jgi:hypothetical protein
MLAEAIDKLAELAQRGVAPVVTTFGGRNYQAGPHRYEQIEEPRAAPLSVHSLGAVVDYLNANKDGLPLSSLVVHVVNPRCVTILGPLRADRTREAFLTAAPINEDPCGNLGRFLSQEDLVLWVQTAFRPTPVAPSCLRSSATSPPRRRACSSTTASRRR